jgi:predicted esterase
MRTLSHSFFCILFITVIFGCGPGNNKINGNSIHKTYLINGKVNAQVSCQKDRNITYALYLPQNYTPARKYPVIIAFDPHGNGVFPLEKYKSLADKYGYILMGSNDSKNGLDMNTEGTIIDALFGETTGRYTIDTTRIYVMGFSGGARIASIIGFYQGNVEGVIGCGAGFPATSQPARFKPDYISIVGNADFNMNELITLDKKLDEANYTHAMIIFNGKHEWPPVDIMENAFIWTELCSMRKGQIIKNDQIIQNFVQSEKDLISKDKEKGNALAEYNHLLNLTRFVNGLMPVDDLKKSLGEVSKSAAYKSQQKQLQQISGKEMQEQKALNDNFFVKDIGWWKRKIKNYEQLITQGKDSSEVRMYKRLKSYLSLLCYMSYNRVLSSNDSVAAKHAMDIYEVVDPENAASTKADKGK